MPTRNRVLTALLIASVTGGAAAPSALAAKTKPASAAAILKDCAKDGTIGKRYRLADLKKARTAAAKKKGKYAACAPALTSAIAGYSGKKGKASTTAIAKECTRGNGGLTRKYKASTLRKAKKSLPADIAEYTSCIDAINSQLNTVK